MINRRDFVAGAALVFVGPTVGLLPSAQPRHSGDSLNELFSMRPSEWVNRHTLALTAPIERVR